MKDLFKYFYVIFLVSAILYGSTYIGFLSIRQLSTLIMLVLLIRERVVFKVDKVIKCYFGFLFFYFLSSVFEEAIDSFLKNFVAYYLVALIGYQATIVLIIKYKAENYLINTMVCIGLFSSLLTILQYFGLGLVSNIVLNNLYLPLADAEHFENLFEFGNKMVNYSLCGAFTSPVPNGYYLSLSGVLILYPFIKANTLLKKNLLLGTWLLVFLGSFYCQQRLSFVVLSAVSIMIFLKYERKYKFLIYFLLFMSIYWFIYNYEKIDLGRYASFQDEARKSLYESGITYISNNVFFAGIWGFRENSGGLSPHNLFLNAFAYSGIFGFILICFILYIKMKACLNFKILFKPSILSIIILGYLTITANSFTHNSSIVTGDIIFWIMWGAIVSLYKRIGGIKGVG